MRIERIVLEDHGDVPVLGRHLIDNPVIDADLSGADLFQSGDHAQRRRFSAAGRAHQHYELFILDINVNSINRANLIIKDLAYLVQLNTRQDFAPVLMPLNGLDGFSLYEIRRCTMIGGFMKSKVC